MIDPAALSPWLLLLAPVVVTLAYTVFGLTGFGAAAISVPLLAHLLPVSFLVPLIVLLDIVASTSLGARHREHVSWAELRWLAQKPYEAGEPLRAGLQSFPMLVKPGGELGFPEQFEDNLPARRTVIGQDRAGRILLMVAPRGYFTLHRLSLYLTGSDLELDIAINLDGGPSSGILVANPLEAIPSQTLLPIVILVHAR